MPFLAAIPLAIGGAIADAVGTIGAAIGIGGEAAAAGGLAAAGASGAGLGAATLGGFTAADLGVTSALVPAISATEALGAAGGFLPEVAGAVAPGVLAAGGDALTGGVGGVAPGTAAAGGAAPGAAAGPVPGVGAAAPAAGPGAASVVPAASPQVISDTTIPSWTQGVSQLTGQNLVPAAGPDLSQAAGQVGGSLAPSAGGSPGLTAAGVPTTADTAANPWDIATNVAGGGGGGGGGGSGILSFAKEWGPLIGGVGGLGYTMLQGSNIPGLSQETALASQTAAGANQLTNYVTSGTLPPGAQQWIDQAKSAAKASVSSTYASMGASGSQMETQDLAYVDEWAKGQAFQEAANLLNSGLQETQITAGLYNNLVNTNLQLAQLTGQAVGNLAASLGGGVNIPVGGGQSVRVTPA